MTSDCTPNFISGPVGCEMPSQNETKSRLKAGGTLFRSVDVGKSTNDISLSVNWRVCNNNTTNCNASLPSDTRNYNPATDNYCNVVGIYLAVYINNQLSYESSVPQTVDCGSPITWASAIPLLRFFLAGNPYVIMPPIDVQTDGTEPESTWDSSVDDADHLGEIPLTYLSGGDGLNSPPAQSELDAIRTGPAFTLYHIGDSEINTADGSLQTINDVKYWGGDDWKSFNSINPPSDCSS